MSGSVPRPVKELAGRYNISEATVRKRRGQFLPLGFAVLKTDYLYGAKHENHSRQN